MMCPKNMWKYNRLKQYDKGTRNVNRKKILFANDGKNNEYVFWLASTMIY